MSATGRGGERRADDAYYTPAWAVHRLMEALPLPKGRWLEPAAGDGAIIKTMAVRRYDIVWDAIELRDTPENQKGLEGVGGSVYFGDFLEAALAMVEAGETYDVVIGNPPFSLAMEFVQASLLLGKHVVMLLRLAFLASAERAAFMRECPPDVFILPNRPCFTGDGQTDSAEYAFFHWPPERNRTSGRLQVLATTPKEERR